MMQRVYVLTTYFLQRLFRSVSGSLFILFMVAYWLILFNPQQTTPDVDYFIILVGVFGAVTAFLMTLTIAGWANQAINYPFLVRLSSRVEYLTAVFISPLIAALLLQLTLALLALVFQGPTIPILRLFEIPPFWLTINILAITLALHASDLVTSGWTRVYIFGLLAVFLFAQGLTNDVLLRLLNGMNRYAAGQEWLFIMDRTSNWINALSGTDTNPVSQAAGIIFWPIRSLVESIILGSFTITQALAPAILLLYATILFILAADIFANKDLAFTEA